MSLIIDGYNLLYAVGVLHDKPGPHGLERARLALLNFLAESLDPRDIPHAVVVFDAHEPPWGAPRSLAHRGLTVHFAVRYEDADSMIEELIRHDSAPRRLTVVSSDHRIQRAARHRKATAVDSDVWCAELVRRRRERHQAAAEAPPRRPVPLLQEDVDYWMRQFGGESLLKELLEKEPPADRPAAGQQPGEPSHGAAGPAADAASGQAAAGEKLKDISGEKIEDLSELANPFPPGYAEDLLAEEENDTPERPFPPGYGEDAQED